MRRTALCPFGRRFALVSALIVCVTLSRRAVLAQPFAYVTNSGDGSAVTVLDLATNSIKATIPVGQNPNGIAVSAMSKRAYASLIGTSSVAVIDTSIDAVITTIPLPGSGYIAAVSGDAERVYVSVGFAGVAVIDATTNSVATTIPISGAYRLALSPDGSRLYVATQSGGVAVVDTSTNTVVNTISMSAAYGVAANPLGTRLYVVAQTGILVFDAATGAPIASIPMDISGDGAIVVSANGSRAYAPGGGTLGVIDTSSNSLLTSIPLGFVGLGVAVSADGTRVYVTDPPSGNISVIDAISNQVIGSIPGGYYPREIAIPAATSVSSCSTTPLCGCRWSAKSIFLMRDSQDDTRDRLVWKWIKGAATLASEFGNPASSTSYSLCVYSGDDQAPLFGASIPSDAARWRPIGGKGFKYRDIQGGSDGIEKALLKGSAENKSKTLVKGGGVQLPDVSLEAIQPPVAVQLVNQETGACWQSVFGAGDLQRQSASSLKAKYQHAPVSVETPTPLTVCASLISPTPTDTRTDTPTATSTRTETATATATNTNTPTVGFDCTPGSTQSCLTGQAGICAAGTQTCTAQGMWGTCVQNLAPQPENCSNGLDDDCDGAADAADTDSCFSLTTQLTPAIADSIASCSPDCPACRYESGSTVSVSCPSTIVGTGFIGNAFYPDFNFVAWSGDASGPANPTNVFMNGNKLVSGDYVCREHEPNDGSASQTYVGSSCGGQIWGKIATSGDVDWFCEGVAIPPGKTITVNLLPPAGQDYDVELYDAGSPFYLTGSYNRGAGILESFTYITSASRSGYYSVRVIGYSGASSSADSYLLAYSVSP